MKNLIFILFLLIPFSAKAQQAISSAAGEVNGISWTIGEIVTETIIADNVMVVQGVNQPGKYIPSVGIGMVSAEWEIAAYPNPATDRLIISCEDTESFAWQITNLPGQKIAMGVSETGNAICNVSELPVGHYILTVTSQEKTKSIIIIKK